MFKNLRGYKIKGKRSQTKYAKRMRALRKNETKNEKKIRLAHRYRLQKRYLAFEKRVNETH